MVRNDRKHHDSCSFVEINQNFQPLPTETLGWEIAERPCKDLENFKKLIFQKWSEMTGNIMIQAHLLKFHKISNPFPLKLWVGKLQNGHVRTYKISKK